MYTDKTLTCADCGQQFVFTASEQDFYAQRGFSEPRRCASCRASRKAARGNGGGGYGASSGGGYSSSSYGSGGGYGGVAEATQNASAVRARCSRQPAAIAARKPWFRSAQQAESPFIAVIVSGACAAPDPALRTTVLEQQRPGFVSQPGSFCVFRGQCARWKFPDLTPSSSPLRLPRRPRPGDPSADRGSGGHGARRCGGLGGPHRPGGRRNPGRLRGPDRRALQQPAGRGHDLAAVLDAGRAGRAARRGRLGAGFDPDVQLPWRLARQRGSVASGSV